MSRDVEAHRATLRLQNLVLDYVRARAAGDTTKAAAAVRAELDRLEATSDAR